jgi:hypothetical protein
MKYKIMYIQAAKKTLKSLALITMLWTCARPSELSTEAIGDITVGVVQHYHATCVYMLRATQEQGQLRYDSSYISAFLKGVGG